jgi:hypothetical protein
MEFQAVSIKDRQSIAEFVAANTASGFFSSHQLLIVTALITLSNGNAQTEFSNEDMKRMIKVTAELFGFQGICLFESERNSG